VSKTIQFADDVVAKHVFGELTLGDVWESLSKRCVAITAQEHEYKAGVRWSSNSRHFPSWKVRDFGLQLLDDYEPLPFFPFSSKVVAKKDHLMVEQKGLWVELYLYELKPMRFDIIPKDEEIQRTVSKPDAVLKVTAVPIPPEIQAKMAEAIRGEK
jgi:hypothetical protein